MTGDTLQLDSALVEALSRDQRYDYDRELVGDSRNLLEWLSDVVSDWLSEQLGVVVDSGVTYYALIAVGLLLIVLLGWLVYRRRHALLRTEERPVILNYTVEEDTIYGIDFDADIAQMAKTGDWRQAVRLVYLQTLRRLSDGGFIDWQPSKTPSQYVSEVADEAFAAMSAQFVRVRYGNFPADESLFLEMKALQKQLEKGGGPAS